MTRSLSRQLRAKRKEDRPSAHAHVQVADTARGIAQALYERLMGDNALRAAWKKQNPGASEKQLVSRFVTANVAKCLPMARATLALLLRSSSDDRLKERVAEALILDASLMKGRAPGAMPAPLPGLKDTSR